MTVLTREQLEAQLARKSPGWWKGAQEMVGRENFYYDNGCRFGLVTVDLHAGTTPMFIACKNPKGCSGVMNSMGYPDPSQKPKWLGPATHGWYRPERVDDDQEDEKTDHIMDGGLLLRELTEDERAARQAD